MSRLMGTEITRGVMPQLNPSFTFEVIRQSCYRTKQSRQSAQGGISVFHWILAAPLTDHVGALVSALARSNACHTWPNLGLLASMHGHRILGFRPSLA